MKLYDNKMANSPRKVRMFLSEKNIKNPGYADVIGCSLFDYREFLDDINEKQGKKQKKQGFKGFFSWLDQYI